MSDFMDNLFGPLSGEYCYYFYFLSIFTFALFLMVIVGGLYAGLSKGKDLGFYASVLGGSLMYFIVYFVNRLMYSICKKSL
jgi:hypothetical protein